MIKESDYIKYLDALLKGDKRKCIFIVNLLLKNGEEIKDIYINLLQRSMYRIGYLWEKGRCSISEERIASDITSIIVDLIYPHIISGAKCGKKVVITCTDKEHHSIGARMISDFFELNGWHSTFLGASVPCLEVVKYIGKNPPHLIGISSNCYLNINRLIGLIEIINNELPGNEIIVGGQIFSKGGEVIVEKYKNVKYISTIKKLESFIRKKSK